MNHTPHMHWDDEGVLHVGGAWELAHHQALSALLSRPQENCPTQMVIDGSGLQELDTAGALLLRHFIEHCGIAHEQVELMHFRAHYERFVREIWGRDVPQQSANESRTTWLGGLLSDIGAASESLLLQAANMLAFTGQIACHIGGIALRPSRLRLSSLVRHMDEAGLRAIPIVSLLAFLISIVLGYQGATQLKMFGADIFTVDLTVVSILREMGVLLTAIMVAGRSGSAFATEIGVMKLREEVDAMHTIGLEPFQLLVVPRVLALVIMLPVLTFIADMCGLLGTYLMTYALLDIGFEQFVERCRGAIELSTFMVGMAKAPVFGFLIAIVGTYQGMQVKGSAESVGRLTTVAVVQSIFLVILADACFSILFSEFDL